MEKGLEMYVGLAKQQDLSILSFTDLSLFNNSEGFDLIFIDKTPPFYTLLLIFIKVELHNYNVI